MASFPSPDFNNDALVSVKAAFNPSRRGTPEHLWRARLDPLPAWEPSTPRIVVVSPHPDDEVFGTGGLIRAWVHRGRRVTLVSITDGEAAYPQWRGLDEVRRKELKRALHTLCDTELPCIRLRIPDGGVARHKVDLWASLSALVDEDTTLVAPSKQTVIRIMRQRALCVASWRMPGAWGLPAIPSGPGTD